MLNAIITIHVQLLGYFQMMVGTMHLTFELPAGATAGDVWNVLVEQYLQLQSEHFDSAAGLSVNGMLIQREQWDTAVLHDGTKLILFSRMAGG